MPPPRIEGSSDSSAAASGAVTLAGSSARSWAVRHFDALAIATLLVLAILIRLAVVFRVPLLVTGDSETYLGPAYALARGDGFDLSIKRTPAYPVFIAGSIWLQGEDLLSLALVQHVLGLVTVGCTYWLGRTIFGRVPGLLAGSAVAVSGPLVLAEQSLMTEALFIPAITMCLALTAAGLRSQNPLALLIAGGLLGIGTLIRPVNQALLPLLLLAPVVAFRPWKRALLGLVLCLAGYGLVVGPWALRPDRDTEGAALGSLGQTLVGRTARHDRGAFTYYDPVRDANDEPSRLAARQVLQEAADRGSSGRAVHTRLRKELGLSAGEVDALMRDLAIEAILRQPDYYVVGTVQRFVRLSQGAVERLRDLRNTNDVARQRWEDTNTRHLVPPATPAQDREAAAAEAVTGLFQPGRVGLAIVLLALVGALGTLVGHGHRSAWLVLGAAAALLFASVALVGNVPRYRYPVDPLLAVLATGGLCAAALMVWRAVGGVRLSRLRRLGSTGPTASPG